MSRGKEYDYLRMGLDFSSPSSVRIEIVWYIKDTIDGFTKLII